ncbi:lantibiotic dehydratase [Labedaea rhizosphaerae]|uniref:Lantibiotic biosynthesis dehydratase-like protein n=1 Tax=Labedaea rhizosphaerae TaxID=598644 RepID=A0A4R6S8N2_LABRH|nr:lantibiotic dehydratase [Labedaea rhizosphaerae]TDP95215.1 lantibiotic biosynthesis dehydratase-like protein [Labedaea rhizosphaerae]
MTVPDHLVALPGTSWHAWRDALLRTTGFPVDGLDRFAAPSAARAADAFLDGRSGRDDFDAAFAEAAASATRTAHDLAGDPLFREAVTWQNPAALTALDGLRKAGPAPDAARQNKKSRYRQRIREELVARYWQRYCAKNESVGFFGPVAWVALDPDGPAAQVKPGAGLVRDRRVWFERWALAAFATRLGENPSLKPKLPVRLKAPLLLDGHQVLRPAQPPLTVTATEAAALALCDGRSAAAVAAELGLHKAADAFVLLGQLAERELITWGIDLPLSPDAEDVLVGVLREIGAEGEFEPLRAARDAVAAAAGDPDRLAAALSTLDSTFVEAASVPARHRDGEMYAGRSLCYEDTVRDLDVVLGAPVLEALAAPMELLLRSVRWLSAAIADAYTAALRELYDDLAAELGTATIPAGPLWYLAQGPLFGSVERPADAVTAEFVRRWAAVFDADPSAAAVSFTSAALADAVAEQFPAARPGWSGARLHSPDLTLCAPSVDALNRGEFSVVLGELHAAWSTFNCAFFVLAHEDPARLRKASREDLGPDRSLLLYPPDFPRLTGRLARYLDDDSDIQLVFTDAPGAVASRLMPVTALTVSDVDGELVAAAPDGRTWPLIELFGELVAMHAVDAFKLVAAAPHTPRITIDRLVVSRETWRCTVAESGLAEAREYADRFLAARRWRARLGLPERVFVKIATETKPVYVDFTAPRYVSSFCAMVRAAGPDVLLTVTEMLPTPDQAWVPDAEGRKYFSELRLQVRDPEPAS